VKGEEDMHDFGLNTSRKEEIWPTETLENNIEHCVREIGSA